MIKEEVSKTPPATKGTAPKTLTETTTEVPESRFSKKQKQSKSKPRQKTKTKTKGQSKLKPKPKKVNKPLPEKEDE